MAKSAGLNSSFFLGGFDISGDVSAIDRIAGPRTTYDVTAINVSATERIYGRGDAEIDFTTFFNDASGQEHLALRGLPRTDVIALACLQSTAGDVCAFTEGKQIDYNWSRPDDGSLTGKVSVRGDGAALEWGTLVIAKSTVEGTGNSASQDNGASSAAGAAAVVMCTAFSGSNYTATLQDSTDDSSFATLIAFTQITAVNKAERKTVSGTINRYTRVNHAGTFSAVDVIVAIRRGDAADIDGY